MTYDRCAQLVREFVDAFNTRDEDRFLAALDPAVELHLPRGIACGHAEAAEWMRHPYDHLALCIDLENVVVGDGWAIGVTTARYSWTETGELADEATASALFEISGAGIRRWRPFPDTAEALAAVGLVPIA